MQNDTLDQLILGIKIYNLAEADESLREKILARLKQKDIEPDRLELSPERDFLYILRKRR